MSFLPHVSEQCNAGVSGRRRPSGGPEEAGIGGCRRHTPIVAIAATITE
ncbi:MAG: hypothetical protein MUF46_09110 [Desulfobacterales bacterium]|nr:hypothetical protein [Desulfobacterales bacterium]